MRVRDTAVASLVGGGVTASLHSVRVGLAAACTLVLLGGWICVARWLAGRRR